MNRFKQCTYTVILLLTCLVASPMIFKQIWTNSEKKKKEVVVGTAEIDITKGMTTSAAQQSGGAPAATTPAATAAPGETLDTNAALAVETTTAAPQPAAQSFQFVESDISYLNDALFIGDSRTVGLEENSKITELTDADFFCDVGLASHAALSSAESGTLGSMLESNNYGKIYIMLGINEVGNNFDTTMSNYSELVNIIRQKAPNAIIYIEANLRVAEYAQTGGITNERINTLNSMMQALADNQHIFYIDINPIFDDGYGNLREDVTPDGIHVQGKYTINWRDWLCLNTVQINSTSQPAPAQTQVQVQVETAPAPEAVTTPAEPVTQAPATEQPQQDQQVQTAPSRIIN